MRSYKIPARVATILLAGAAAVGMTVAAPTASAAPAELSFSSYYPVNPGVYQSKRFADDGRYFFTAGGFQCQIGRPGSVACKGRPASAPAGVLGVAITHDLQGPWWVRPGSNFRFTSRAGFPAKTLGVGSRITANNVVCAAPRPGTVTCASQNRAFTLSRGSYRFYAPPGDRAHSPNRR